jgi:beta-N-acetylhexosaminidase
MATLDETDFFTFEHVAAQVGAEKLWAMTAHVVFTALDDQPVSISRKAIDFIRDELGVIGPIIPDAIEMEALGGTIIERALATLNAGCDAVLHCSGKFDDVKAIAEALPDITNEAKKRFDVSISGLRKTYTGDWRDQFQELQNLLTIEEASGYQAHEALTRA